MATPFPFTTGQVLTAAQMNAITELVINDKTDSYTLVAGDAGERVIMNKATSSTITVPNSVFTAGQVVYIANKGAGVCTVTAGAGTTVSSTGSLALAQYATGTLLALSASAFIFQAGGVTAASGALTFITGASFSAVTSVSLPANTFSATYRNYKVIFNFTCSVATGNNTLRMRTAGTDNTTSNYDGGVIFTSRAGSTGNAGTQAQSSFALGTNHSFGAFVYTFDVFAPQVSENTTWAGTMHGSVGGATGGGAFGGLFNDTTAFDSLSIITSTGTITGVYRVYGYADS